MTDTNAGFENKGSESISRGKNLQRKLNDTSQSKPEACDIEVKNGNQPHFLQGD